MKYLALVILALISRSATAQTNNPEINKLITKYILTGGDSQYAYSWNNTNQPHEDFADCRCDLYEWKGLRYSIKADSLTEADTLNGITFRGSVILTPKTYRTFNAGGAVPGTQVTISTSKSIWKSSNTPFYIDVEKANGKWTASIGSNRWIISPISSPAPTRQDLATMKKMDKEGKFGVPN